MGMLAPRSFIISTAPLTRWGTMASCMYFRALPEHWRITGRFRLDAANNDGLELLQVVKIVSRHGIAPGHGLLKHLPGIHQSEFFIINLSHYPDSCGEGILVRGPLARPYPGCGPAWRTSELTWSAKVLKFSANMPASFLAWASYAALSLQVFRGVRISAGTPGHSAGHRQAEEGLGSHGGLGEGAVQSRMHQGPGEARRF